MVQVVCCKLLLNVTYTSNTTLLGWQARFVVLSEGNSFLRLPRPEADLSYGGRAVSIVLTSLSVPVRGT